MGGANLHFVSNISTTNNAKSTQFFIKDPLSNKPVGGIANARHGRNIESQLIHFANLSDSSIFKHSQHKNADKERERDTSLYLG